MAKSLTLNMVLSRCRVDTLEQVRKLNVWGSDLTDVALVAEMPNVEVISLSVNKIKTLKEFAKCYKLRELYLRKNEIADVSELLHLQGLTNLSVLWLSENPCAEDSGYRLAVIRVLPQLEKLDDVTITLEERRQAEEGISEPAASPPSPSPPRVQSYVSQESISQPPRVTHDALLEQRDMNPAPAPPVPPARRTMSLQEPPHYAPVLPSTSTHEQITVNAGRMLPGRSSPNILYAVLTLLDELDTDGLRIVRAQLDKRLIRQV